MPALRAWLHCECYWQQLLFGDIMIPLETETLLPPHALSVTILHSIRIRAKVVLNYWTDTHIGLLVQMKMKQSEFSLRLMRMSSDALPIAFYVWYYEGKDLGLELSNGSQGSILHKQERAYIWCRRSWRAWRVSLNKCMVPLKLFIKHYTPGATFCCTCWRLSLQTKQCNCSRGAVWGVWGCVKSRSPAENVWIFRPRCSRYVRSL